MKNICILIYKFNKTYISTVSIPYFSKNCSIVVPYRIGTVTHTLKRNRAS